MTKVALLYSYRLATLFGLSGSVSSVAIFGLGHIHIHTHTHSGGIENILLPGYEEKHQTARIDWLCRQPIPEKFQDKYRDCMASRIYHGSHLWRRLQDHVT